MGRGSATISQRSVTFSCAVHLLSTTEKSKDQRQATHREGAHDFMQCDKNRATGNYVEEDKNASAHPSPPTAPFPEKR